MDKHKPNANNSFRSRELMCVSVSWLAPKVEWGDRRKCSSKARKNEIMYEHIYVHTTHYGVALFGIK